MKYLISAEMSLNTFCEHLFREVTTLNLEKYNGCFVVIIIFLSIEETFYVIHDLQTFEIPLRSK